MTDNVTLYHGDCLELMERIPDKSISAVICDLPFGVLSKSNPSAKWDSIIPFEPLWAHYKRVCKDNAAIVLFAQGMFTAKLMMSNPDMWRYNLVWDKVNRPTGFLDANRKPMRIHEDIVVFYGSQPTYNPQFSIGQKCHSRGKAGNSDGKCKNRNYGKFKATETVMTNKKYPTSILSFEKQHIDFSHQTQKPVDLLRYLIRTYSNEGDTILDNTMGSGSTGVAAVMENRKFVGIEKDDSYFSIAQKRINEAIIKKSSEIQFEL